MTKATHSHHHQKKFKLCAKKPLDKHLNLCYIISMNNDIRTFEIWILIGIVLFIGTLAFGFYIESI